MGGTSVLTMLQTREFVLGKKVCTNKKKGKKRGKNTKKKNRTGTISTASVKEDKVRKS